MAGKKGNQQFHHSSPSLHHQRDHHNRNHQRQHQHQQEQQQQQQQQQQSLTLTIRLIMQGKEVGSIIGKVLFHIAENS